MILTVTLEACCSIFDVRDTLLVNDFSRVKTCPRYSLSQTPSSFKHPYVQNLSKFQLASKACSYVS